MPVAHQPHGAEADRRSGRLTDEGHPFRGRLQGDPHADALEQILDQLGRHDLTDRLTSDAGDADQDQLLGAWIEFRELFERQPEAAVDGRYEVEEERNVYADVRRRDRHHGRHTGEPGATRYQRPALPADGLELLDITRELVLGAGQDDDLAGAVSVLCQLIGRVYH